MVGNLQRDGFACIKGVLGADQVTGLTASLGPLLEANTCAGIRGLAQKSADIRALAESDSLRALVEPVLGAGARMIRSVLFNKNQDVNWQVAWHQDLAIAVKRREDVKGYDSWSIKDGLVHVQPPTRVLEEMLTVRLHLDAADEHNGALWVSPGSHRHGRVPAAEAATRARDQGTCLCALAPGDVMVFRPLLLHASRKAVSTRARRVIHLEFAAHALPHPLEWNDLA